MHIQFLGRRGGDIFLHGGGRRELQTVINGTSGVHRCLVDTRHRSGTDPLIGCLVQNFHEFPLFGILVISGVPPSADLLGKVFLDDAWGREDYLIRVHLGHNDRGKFKVFVRGVKFVLLRPILRRLLFGLPFQVI
jgi:hypothetical protein